MRQNITTRIRKLLVALCSIVLAVSIVGLLGGSSCYYGHHCDDDDDHHHSHSHCDDDHNHSTLAPPDGPEIVVDDRLQGGRWNSIDFAARDRRGLAASPQDPAVLEFVPLIDGLVLEQFKIVSSEVPNTHPFRKLVDIQGISLFSEEGPTDYGAQELKGFTSRLLSSNQHLIGVAPEAGQLRFEGVRFTDLLMIVDYQQVFYFEGDTEPSVLPAAGVRFAFDRLGRLLQIDNTIILRPEESPTSNRK